MTGIGKPVNPRKHQTAVCEKCRFWSQGQRWCNYGDVMHTSRLKAGAKLLPEGGCTLFEVDEVEGETQQTIKDNWGNGKTDGEAYYKAIAGEIIEKRQSTFIPDSVWEQVKELYFTGLMDPEIARECGIGKSSVRRWRRRNGLNSNYQVKKIERAT